jgi:hypothetical protein
MAATQPHRTAVRMTRTDAAPPAADQAPPSWAARYEAIRDDPRTYRRMLGLLAAAMVAFSIAPVANNLLGHKNKDYDLWYRTGRIVLDGGEIYPKERRLFPFMYPPAAAAMLGVASAVGDHPFVVLLTATNSAAWLASILLSVSLATGKVARQHPLLYLVPTLWVIPYVHDMYLLGQPNLLLLAIMLGAFACLRLGRPWAAGGLIGLAAAIKAFPIMALGYLVYRRQWKATAATVLTVAALLMVLPLPFRGPTRAWDDLVVWTRGMVLKYDAEGIAQRPERCYGFKNQSLVALGNRLLRDVPADGEARDGWHVNVANLDFRTVNVAIVATALALCAFYMATMPRRDRRTAESDAIETSMLLLLILAFSPFSFNYFFVWLLYPLTVLLNLILQAPAPSRERTVLTTGMLMALTIFASAIPLLRPAQAYGNLLVSSLILLGILGWAMRRKAAAPVAVA